MSIDRPKEVTAYHLAGLAGVYIRQSSDRQIEENKGSTDYQRNQARWPRLWGWAEDQIQLFEDLGLSGAASDHRLAFLRINEEIKAKRLRAIFVSDQSRLARNSIEWFRFLELCRSHNVLVALDGRILNLGDGGDGFSSRIMALERQGRDRRSDGVYVGRGRQMGTGPRSGRPSGHF
jgi:DNA invertase Pin-like site-specific DNA recombinase